MPLLVPNNHSERLRFIKIAVSQILSNHNSILTCRPASFLPLIFPCYLHVPHVTYTFPLLFQLSSHASSASLHGSPPSFLSLSPPLLESEVPPILSKALYWPVGFYWQGGEQIKSNVSTNLKQQLLRVNITKPHAQIETR